MCFCFFSCAHFRLRTYTLTDPQHPSYTIFSYVLVSFDVAIRAGQLTRRPLVLTRNSNICHAGACLARISIFGRRLNQHHHAFSLYYNTSILYVQHPRSGRSSNYATHSPIHSSLFTFSFSRPQLLSHAPHVAHSYFT
jgi:hypothetical protein